MRNFIVKYVFVLVFLILPQAAFAACNGQDVVNELRRVGISTELDEFDDGIWYLKVWRDGDSTRVYVDADDGDMTFRSWYGEDWQVSLRLANAINDAYRYVQAVIDKDGDMIISYYHNNFDEGCSQHLKEHTRAWWDLEDAIEGYMRNRIQ